MTPEIISLGQAAHFYITLKCEIEIPVLGARENLFACERLALIMPRDFTICYGPYDFELPKTPPE